MKSIAAIIAVAAVTLLAAACRGSPSSADSGGSQDAGGSANSRQGLADSACMRSHRVPNWPDPTNGPAGWGFNLVHVHGFDPNSPQIDHKMSGCSQTLPAGVGVPLSRPGATRLNSGSRNGTRARTTRSGMTVKEMP